MSLIRSHKPRSLHRVCDNIIHSPNPLENDGGLIIFKKEKDALKKLVKEEFLYSADRFATLKNVLKIRYGHLIELFLPLSVFARSISELKYFEKLEKLEIKLNQPLFLLHEELEQIPFMRFIEIRDDEFINLSFNDVNLPNLKSLKIHGVNSDHVKYQFSTLKTLEELSIQNTTMFFPPKSLLDLINLKKLVLTNNLLFAIPEPIGFLRNLEYIDLSNNILKWIPESFMNLTQLHYLDLRDNEIDQEEQLNQRIITSLKERGCKVFL